MGRGFDLARELAPEHVALIEEMKEQLLIVCMKRLKRYGDDLRFPVAEIDDTGGDMLAFGLDGTSAFQFELRRKS